MWKNRSPKTVVPETSVEVARARVVEIEDEMERIADLAHQMGADPTADLMDLELELQEAEEEYWRAVDMETEAAIAEVEAAMEKGLDLW